MDEVLKPLLKPVPPSVVQAAVEARPAFIVSDVVHYLALNVLALEAIVKARAEGDLTRYVHLHHDAYKPHALLQACHWGMSGADFWSTLETIWTMAQVVGFTKELWILLFEQELPPGRRAVMSAAELEVFDALPETLTLYRGAQAKYRRGLSWTLSAEVAQFFAQRTGGQVWRVKVPRSAALAYFGGREESEIIVKLPRGARVGRLTQ